MTLHKKIEKEIPITDKPRDSKYYQTTQRTDMKKIALLMTVALLTVGCTTQPSTGSKKSNDETLSKNKIKVFTLGMPLSIGGTHITAESGSHITITPNSIKGN